MSLRKSANPNPIQATLLPPGANAHRRFIAPQPARCRIGRTHKGAVCRSLTLIWIGAQDWASYLGSFGGLHKSWKMRRGYSLPAECKSLRILNE